MLMLLAGAAGCGTATHSDVTQTVAVERSLTRLQAALQSRNATIVCQLALPGTATGPGRAAERIFVGEVALYVKRCAQSFARHPTDLEVYQRAIVGLKIRRITVSSEVAVADLVQNTLGLRQLHFVRVAGEWRCLCVAAE